MTNYERIKNMKIWEMAKAISDGISSDPCDYCPYNEAYCDGKPCIHIEEKEIITNWLESEVNAEGKTAPIAPGERFTCGGIEFVVLGMEQGGVLAVTAKQLNDEMAYDENGSNDWRKSSLRKYLNEEFIKKFDKGDLLPFVSDLTSNDGMTDYGTSEDFVALLSDNLYRKYRKFMPKYDTWVWTITPWSCHPGYADIECLVGISGALSISNACYSLGVAPACIFNPEIFK